MESEKMSVKKSQREESELNVIVLARGICSHTIAVTANEKFFPKRHRWQLTNKIVDTSVSAYENLVRANEVKLGEPLRVRYQNRAKEDFKMLLSFIDLSIEAFNFPARRAEYWTGLVTHCIISLNAWIKSDRKRIEESEV